MLQISDLRLTEKFWISRLFEHLEQLPVQLEMGRMTERSYRDEVNEILKFWQDEHLFDDSTLSSLDEAFNARERQKEEEDKARRLLEKRERERAMSYTKPLRTRMRGMKVRAKWKSMRRNKKTSHMKLPQTLTR